MLVARRVTGFRTGPHAVKDLWAVLQVEAKTLEMVVPVRILDDDLDLWIDGLRRTDDQVPARFVHEFQAILRPAPVTFRGDFDILLATGEEKVVQEELVEVSGRVLGNLLDHRPVLGIGVTEGFEIVRLIDGVSDTARHLKALGQEELLGLLQGGVVNQQEVAVGFKVDLVHVQLAGNGLPGRLEPLRVFHLFHLVRPHVHGNFEILVMRPGGNGQDQESEKDQVQDSSHNGNRRMPFPVRAASTGNKDNNYL